METKRTLRDLLSLWPGALGFLGLAAFLGFAGFAAFHQDNLDEQVEIAAQRIHRVETRMDPTTNCQIYRIVRGQAHKPGKTGRKYIREIPDGPFRPRANAAGTGFYCQANIQAGEQAGPTVPWVD